MTKLVQRLSKNYNITGSENSSPLSITPANWRLSTCYQICNKWLSVITSHLLNPNPSCCDLKTIKQRWKITNSSAIDRSKLKFDYDGTATSRSFRNDNFRLPVIFFEGLYKKVALEKSFPTNTNMTYIALARVEKIAFEVCRFSLWKKPKKWVSRR